MNAVARIFVVLNLLLAAGFLFAAATFLQQSTNWQKKHGEAEEAAMAAEAASTAQIDKLNEQINGLQSDLRSRGDELSALKNDNSDLQTRLTAAQESRTTAEQNEQKLQGSVQTSSSELAKLTQQLTDLESMIDRYKEQTIAANSARDEAVRAKTVAVEELQTERDNLHASTQEVERLNSEWEATKTTLASYAGNYPPPAVKDRVRIDGQITQYNALANVVQINRGKNDGVALGHEFDIVRGGAFICTVKVDSVQAGSCIGHVTSVRVAGRKPQSGDAATAL